MYPPGFAIIKNCDIISVTGHKLESRSNIIPSHSQNSEKSGSKSVGFHTWETDGLNGLKQSGDLMYSEKVLRTTGKTI